MWGKYEKTLKDNISKCHFRRWALSAAGFSIIAKKKTTTEEITDVTVQ